MGVTPVVTTTQNSQPAPHFSQQKITSMFTNTCSSSLFLLLLLLSSSTISAETSFVFNGFTGANLTLSGIASITPGGLLQLTNTTLNSIGHAFIPTPVPFTKPLSFSTTFVFAIVSELPGLSGQGMALAFTPTTNITTTITSQYLGLFNERNNGNSTDHILAVELDTVQNPEFQDINDNHVGIDVNSLKSSASQPAGYYENDTDSFHNLTLISGEPMQVWVEYDGEAMQLDVTMAPLKMPKPSRPLLSSTLNLSTVMLDSMYVGFSSADGPFLTHHYVLGWSFKMNGTAEPLDYTKLPAIPAVTTNKGKSNHFAVWLPVALCPLVLLIVALVVFITRRRKKYAELLEDWELEYGPRRFSYKDLYRATKGFREKELLGTGGFGRVYKGVLPTSGMEIAVKRVSHDSSQGLREFVAEICSIGQLRHRNLVQLLGYCRRKGELLLVYEFMPNGSLDKYLYDRTGPTLDWAQRFRIIRGVASGLLYLHEDWEQVVVHRDIKASNVLLDGELNGKLGDFGLARLYDRGAEPATTRVVGTMGYLAPELTMMGKASTASDVFAFGAFMLEVVCGKRPIERYARDEELILIDWVIESWKSGLVFQTIDPRLRSEYCECEVELVLKLGLLCSHPLAAARPSMRQVMRILDGDAEMPELLVDCLSFSRALSSSQDVGFDDYSMSFASSTVS